jgi:hypothetical protein
MHDTALKDGDVVNHLHHPGEGSPETTRGPHEFHRIAGGRQRLAEAIRTIEATGASDPREDLYQVGQGAGLNLNYLHASSIPLQVP